MKKVTTLLAALALASVAFVGPATAATVAGVDVSDLNVSVTTTDGSDAAVSIGGTTPISLAGVDFGLELALGVNGNDILSDVNVSYDAFTFGEATVFVTGGVGFNLVDKDTLGVDVRVGPGVSYAFPGGKSLFVTYTVGYDFDREDNDTQLRVGLSLKF